jgi:hypothetical protein
MRKFILSAAFLLGGATMHQAAACDMGAIESVVASACHGTCAAVQQPAQGCDGGNCTKVHPAASNIAPAPPAPMSVACTGSSC